MDLNGVLTRLCKAVEKIADQLESLGEKKGAGGAGKHLTYDYSPPFEEWWLHYPRKTAKPRAFKSYEAAVARGATQNDMIAMAELYRDAWTPERLKEGDFRMYPSTWLNQCMYECDVSDFYENGVVPKKEKQLWE
jgi:hypothetical protein